MRACGQRNAYGAAGERAEARGRGWVRVLPGNSTELRRPAFLCRASRQIPAALSSVSLLCLTAHPCRAFGASLPFSLGKVAVMQVAGFSEVALGGRGVAGSWAGERLRRGREWAGPTAGERAEARGRGWVRVLSGNSTGLRLAAFLCCVFGVFRQDPCRAFRRFLAVPYGPSMSRLRRFPALQSGEGGGSAGGGGFRGGFGGRGVVGLRTGKRRQLGRGAGGAHCRG